MEKAFKCEMCGSIDIVKRNGMYVCQYCGTKFSTKEVQSGVPSIDTLLERAFYFLEDKDWKNAEQYFNRVLDASPTDASAYIGKLCARLQIAEESELSQHIVELESYSEFKKALQFATSEYKAILDEYNQSSLHIINALETQKRYEEAVNNSQSNLVQHVIYAKELFCSIADYKDAKERVSWCEKRIKIMEAENARQERRARLFQRVALCGTAAFGVLLGFIIACLVSLPFNVLTDEIIALSDSANNTLLILRRIFMIVLSILGGVQCVRNDEFFTRSGTSYWMIGITILFICGCVGVMISGTSHQSNDLQLQANKKNEIQATYSEMIDGEVIQEKYKFDKIVKYIGYCNGNTVNIRNKPNSDTGEIVTTIKTNEIVQIIDKNHNDKWDKILVDGQEVYIFNKYIDYLCSIEEADLTEIRIDKDTVAVFESADMDSRVILTLYEEDSVVVLLQENEWYAVKAGDKIGYINENDWK